MRQENSSRKQKITIQILAAVIAVLILAILYFFVAQPQMNNYVAKKQVEGIDYVINTILVSIQNQGYVEIPVGNQTLVLVPYVPEQTQPATN